MEYALSMALLWQALGINVVSTDHIVSARVESSQVAYTCQAYRSEKVLIDIRRNTSSGLNYVKLVEVSGGDITSEINSKLSILHSAQSLSSIKLLSCSHEVRRLVFSAIYLDSSTVGDDEFSFEIVLDENGSVLE